MRKFFAVTSVICVLLFVSCQQEPDDVLREESPTEINDSDSDSTYLSAIVSLDITNPSAPDTLGIAHFIYDGQKRLEEIRDFEYNNGIPGDIAHFEKRFYNGNDTLPYKIVAFSDRVSPSEDIIDTVFLTYQNGIVIADSVIAYIGSQKYSTTANYFKRLSSNRWSAKLYHQPVNGSALIDTLTCYQEWSNGNLISQKDTVFTLPLSDWSETSQYDNHPNPFNRILVPYPWINYFFIGTYLFLIEETRTINNEISVNSSSGTFQSQGQIFYQYRSDGYPISRIYSNIGDTYKELLIYQKL